MAETLNAEELERYCRQIAIEGWGEEGQKRLKKSTVAVIGVGGLGSPVSLYLAAAGVGKLILVDDGKVELSNLNRQVLHWSKDVGRPKVESAMEKIRELNPKVIVESIKGRVSEGNVYEIVRKADVVVDAMDNFASRMLVNKACIDEGKVFVHAGVYGFQGQLTTIIPGEGPCLQCIFPNPPPVEDAIPVAAPIPGILGCMQANEVIKVVTGIGRPLVGRLLIYDGEDSSFIIVDVKREEKCPVCGVT
ncbi:MAG: HesA/MoeB/ThiF family protein [Candidatus Jordarchaeales archaeon]